MKSHASEQSGKSIQNGDISHMILLHTLKEHRGTVYSVAWSLDGRMLASSSQGKGINLWDGQMGLCVFGEQAHGKQWRY
jgi:WD40 repeat protein